MKRAVVELALAVAAITLRWRWLLPALVLFDTFMCGFNVAHADPIPVTTSGAKVGIKPIVVNGTTVSCLPAGSGDAGCIAATGTQTISAAETFSNDAGVTMRTLRVTSEQPGVVSISVQGNPGASSPALDNPSNVLEVTGTYPVPSQTGITAASVIIGDRSTGGRRQYAGDTYCLAIIDALGQLGLEFFPVGFTCQGDEHLSRNFYFDTPTPHLSALLGPLVIRSHGTTLFWNDTTGNILELYSGGGASLASYFDQSGNLHFSGSSSVFLTADSTSLGLRGTSEVFSDTSVSQSSGSIWEWYNGGVLKAAVRFDGAGIFAAGTTVGGDRVATNTVGGSATVDFGTITNDCQDSTDLALSGAAVGDICVLGFPATIAAHSDFFCRVSSSGNVKITHCAHGTIDPASATYTFRAVRQ
jgi:hypothetical protein